MEESTYRRPVTVQWLGSTTMSLTQSAKLNGHDPYAYLKDVLQRRPTQRASAINELLPHRWLPADKVR
jgi:transposase